MVTMFTDVLGLRAVATVTDMMGRGGSRRHMRWLKGDWLNGGDAVAGSDTELVDMMCSEWWANKQPLREDDQRGDV
ncbi:hypothetical protein RIF29_21939 [Crotalaria pallida]|uniref:Uncharacterized protein n=1 Tax=Crotalaria pallida TaxID=3830 RepID=A0AAN9F7U5_CROPI